MPVRFFHFVPAKSFTQSPLRSLFQTAAGVSVFTLLSDKFVKLVLQTTLPANSCVERLFVCTSASLLI